MAPDFAISQRDTEAPGKETKEGEKKRRWGCCSIVLWSTFICFCVLLLAGGIWVWHTNGVKADLDWRISELRDAREAERPRLSSEKNAAYLYLAAFPLRKGEEPELGRGNWRQPLKRHGDPDFVAYIEGSPGFIGALEKAAALERCDFSFEGYERRKNSGRSSMPSAVSFVAIAARQAHLQGRHGQAVHLIRLGLRLLEHIGQNDIDIGEFPSQSVHEDEVLEVAALMIADAKVPVPELETLMSAICGYRDSACYAAPVYRTLRLETLSEWQLVHEGKREVTICGMPQPVHSVPYRISRMAAKDALLFDRKVSGLIEALEGNGELMAAIKSIDEAPSIAWGYRRFLLRRIDSCLYWQMQRRETVQLLKAAMSCRLFTEAHRRLPESLEEAQRFANTGDRLRSRGIFIYRPLKFRGGETSCRVWTADWDGKRMPTDNMIEVPLKFRNAQVSGDNQVILATPEKPPDDDGKKGGD